QPLSTLVSSRARPAVRVPARVRVGVPRRGLRRGRQVAVVYEAALGGVVAKRLEAGPDVLARFRLARGRDLNVLLLAARRDGDLALKVCAVELHVRGLQA